MVNLIVAITDNNAIGRKGELLFKLKTDMQNFKKLTTDNIVIMGRNTYDSIGKPLPNRINVVLTSEPDRISDFKDGIICFDEMEEAIESMKRVYPDKEIFIIGGGQIYRYALENNLVDKLYITKIKKVVEDADTYFPTIDYRKDWFITNIERYFENDIEFFIYEAIKK